MIKNPEKIWQTKNLLSLLLSPLSIIFSWVIKLRRCAYSLGKLKSWRAPVPVIVIGNISVGGTGKTPFVIFLYEFARLKGYTPGIISRGYKGESPTWPLSVSPNTDPALAGDEPVLISKRTRAPMMVGPNRVESATQLLKKHPQVDLIISDDGLQHYALQRDLEVVMIPSVNPFGNGFLLPAGLLREPVSRLAKADVLISNGFSRHTENQVSVIGNLFCCVKDARLIKVNGIKNKQQRVHAVAGIANPHRFFSHLREMGFDVIEHAFADHHAYQLTDFQFDDNSPVIMTEKDAVKCRSFSNQTLCDRLWYLPIKYQANDALLDRLEKVFKLIESPRALLSLDYSGND